MIKTRWRFKADDELDLIYLGWTWWGIDPVWWIAWENAPRFSDLPGVLDSARPTISGGW